ncbi:endolytic transglycosylase MltG [Candidatus Woesebacteria bacterium]|nr:endolytic transglycosylase MltG [Candidatus Woesebacteria bacterium]
MVKNKLFFLIVFLSFVAVVLFTGIVWWRRNISPVSENEEVVSFLIPKGRSAMQVANALYEKDLIRSPLAFKIYVQISGKSKNINSGEFRLSKDMSLSQVIEALGKGPLELWVTVPEGLRREEILDKFIEALQMDNEKKRSFAAEFMNVSEGKEGYLFPDTYLFPRDASAKLVIDKMFSVFDSKIDQQMKDQIEDSQYDLDDHVIMASIIERETKTDEERPIVAGILWKRLETEGWLIQADATTQYEIGSNNCEGKELNCDSWWPVLTRQDLEILSPYNTYMVDGLPPTPIANPGLGSLKAAIFPQRSDYWFYIHDPEGNIHYAKSISQHNENIRQYLGK